MSSNQQHHWNLDAYRGLLGDYTELRAQENRSFTISFLNGQMVGNANSSEQGISARHFKNGSWGFASHPEIGKRSVEKVLLESGNNAKFMSLHSRDNAVLANLTGAKARLDLSTKKTKLSSQEIINQLKEYDSYIASRYPDLSSRSLRCFQQDFIKEAINSAGSNTFTHYARSFIVVSLSLESPNGPVELREVFGDSGQIEDNFPSLELFKENIESAYTLIKDKANGFVAEGVVKEVILSSRVAGILAHEAIGHTTEADIVLGGSAAADFLGQQVASPIVSLVDFAHTAFGKQAPMPVLFDDEGTTAEDTTII